MKIYGAILEVFFLIFNKGKAAQRFTDELSVATMSQKRTNVCTREMIAGAIH